MSCCSGVCLRELKPPNISPIHRSTRRLNIRRLEVAPAKSSGSAAQTQVAADHHEQTGTAAQILLAALATKIAHCSPIMAELLLTLLTPRIGWRPDHPVRPAVARIATSTLLSN